MKFLLFLVAKTCACRSPRKLTFLYVVPIVNVIFFEQWRTNIISFRLHRWFTRVIANHIVVVVMAKKNYRSPGPKYNAPTTVGYEKCDVRLPRAPAYSLGQLLREQHKSLQVPGPKYNLSNITRHGTIKMTGASLASSRPIGRPVPSPGPAAYNTVPCMPVTMATMPMYSIGSVCTIRIHLVMRVVNIIQTREYAENILQMTMPWSLLSMESS